MGKNEGEGTKSSLSPPKGTSMKGKRRQLPPGFQPTQYSVICGRGAECFGSPGNRRFRTTVQNLFLKSYSEAKFKSQKSKIVSKIVSLVKEASPQGAFIRRCNID